MKNNFTCFFTHFYVITLLDFTPVWYYKKNYNYNSKILITDFFGIDFNYLMIDGNHTFERKKATKESFLVYHIPYQDSLIQKLHT